jgi:hypothetical protein
MQKRKIHDSLILDDTAMLRQERKSKDVDAIKKWSEKDVERLNDNKRITRNMWNELKMKKKRTFDYSENLLNVKRILESFCSLVIHGSSPSLGRIDANFLRRSSRIWF